MKKAALITGASSGIGAATAKLYARNGYFVYLLGRNEERLQEVALECPNGASLLKCDLNNPAQVEKYSRHLFERPDTQLEVLVNNAGIYEQHAFLDQGMEIWRRQFETNFFSSVNWTQKILPLLQKQSQAWIVNVSSGLGLRPSARSPAYSAAKAAMISWTQSLAVELGPQKICVNCVAPGLVDTPIHGFHYSEKKSEVLESLKSLQPLQRIGSSDEIAKAIYFLGSKESPWTTGAVLTVDGGINLL